MTDFRRGSSFGHVARANSKPIYTITRTLDFAETNAAIGTHQVFYIPANTKVIDANVEVISPETENATGTLSLGDTDSAARYVAAATVAAPGYMTATGAKGLAYQTTDKSVTITVAVAALEDAKVKVSVTFADLS